jgi:hypothetical protein
MILRPSKLIRPGLAPLEMVLVLPLLALMAALLYKIGEAGLTKTGTLVEARRNAWSRERGGTPEADPLPVAQSSMLRHAAAGTSSDYRHTGLAVGAASKPVRLTPLLRADGRASARLVVLLDSFSGLTALSTDDMPQRLLDQIVSLVTTPSEETLEMIWEEVKKEAWKAAKEQSDFLKTAEKLYEIVSDPGAFLEGIGKVFEAIGKIGEVFKGLADLFDLMDKLFSEAPY